MAPLPNPNEPLKVWTTPELLKTPPRLKKRPPLIVYWLAPGVNSSEPRASEGETVTFVTDEGPKAAFSAYVSGTPSGLQLSGVFQSPLTGLRLQVYVGCGRSGSASAGPLNTP